MTEQKPFFKGKYFALSWDKARQFKSTYPIIADQSNPKEWFIQLLSQIDDRIGEDASCGARKDDGTLQRPNNVIHNWLKTQTKNKEQQPQQQPKTEAVEEIQDLERFKQERPEEFAREYITSGEEFAELRRKMGNIGTGPNPVPVGDVGKLNLEG